MKAANAELDTLNQTEAVQTQNVLRAVQQVRFRLQRMQASEQGQHYYNNNEIKEYNYTQNGAIGDEADAEEKEHDNQDLEEIEREFPTYTSSENTYFRKGPRGWYVKVLQPVRISGHDSKAVDFHKLNDMYVLRGSTRWNQAWFEPGKEMFHSLTKIGIHARPLHLRTWVEQRMVRAATEEILNVNDNLDERWKDKDGKLRSEVSSGENTNGRVQAQIGVVRKAPKENREDEGVIELQDYQKKPVKALLRQLVRYELCRSVCSLGIHRQELRIKLREHELKFQERLEAYDIRFKMLKNEY